MLDNEIAGDRSELLLIVQDHTELSSLGLSGMAKNNL